MFFPRTSGKQERVLKNVGSFRLRSTWTLMSSLQGGGTPFSRGGKKIDEGNPTQEARKTRLDS